MLLPELSDRPLVMTAVWMAWRRRPQLFDELGLILLRVGWPSNGSPKMSPEERAIEWLERSRWARSSEGPLFERARDLADDIFDLVDDAVTKGELLLYEHSVVVNDWIELRSGKVLRAERVAFADEVRARATPDDLQMNSKLWEGLLKECRDRDLYISRPFTVHIETETGWIKYEMWGPAGAEIEGRRYVRALWLRLATYEEQVAAAYALRFAGGAIPKRREDERWAAENGYPRHLVRKLRRERSEPRVHKPGKPAAKK